ncbi:hypothetical protein BLA23254_02869 [Burkholderia lata]|uniref:Uncharacterized protein n=1 Tax=Burkholderia lata (strain ATCC 17760 / DSM 23089 / LMG 22485 / NCIMB 9086 / R18194 / 383) TaxID=482957 RepID=A0A6P2KUW9_BURL3|nr:hypothetical protein BLA23254_02869 [Burkholderia lata]
MSLDDGMNGGTRALLRKQSPYQINEQSRMALTLSAHGAVVFCPDALDRVGHDIVYG